MNIEPGNGEAWQAEGRQELKENYGDETKVFVREIEENKE